MRLERQRMTCTLAWLLLASSAVYASGGSPMGGGMAGESRTTAEPPSPEKLAQDAYNSGIREVKKA